MGSTDGLDKSVSTRNAPGFGSRRPVATGGVISPPESSQSSSDEEITDGRGRIRELANLAELQAAIRIIEQHRMGSPDGPGDVKEKTKRTITLDLNGTRFDLSADDLTAKSEESSRLPLSAEARKISHSRSNTDSSARLDFARPKLDSPSRSYTESDLEEVEDDDFRTKPAMVRKKSGELVRPALRPASAKRRPSSMPGTPTYSKAVHFDSSLEHIRHFLQVDRPIAVSAGSSPVESTYEDEVEFPFGSDEPKPLTGVVLGPPFEWVIRIGNFPAETPERMSRPVRVERIYLSADNKSLMGVVAAKNIAFHKLVVARFTLDHWKTTSEVVADYSKDARSKIVNGHDGYDRFVFSIKLEDQANLEKKTMFFCIRYHVNGQDFWDNNNSVNYQIDFSKKARPQKGKNGMQGKNTRPLNAISRSKLPAPFSPRPRSMPTTADEFATSFPNQASPSFSQPSPCAVEDSPGRLWKANPENEIIPDAPGRRVHAAGNAFGNRYNFGASLSATMQAASNGSSEKSKSGARNESSQFPFPSSAPVAPSSTSSSAKTTSPKAGAKAENVPNAAKDPASTATGNPLALAAEKPSLQSSTYHELLDKYCFVRSTISK